MKVFLSYPSEQIDTAREVNKFLRSVGVESWFDKDSLVAGEDWDRARALALKEANVIIILCASQLITRNGVYQREINEALQALNDRRAGTVYIIPLRLEDVSLPPELSRIQYVDYFAMSWRRQVATGLARAATEAGQTVPAALAVAAAQPDEGGTIPRSFAEKQSGGTLDARWLNYALEGVYWEFVNGAITARALGGLYAARRQLTEWWQPSGSTWNLNISEFYRKGQLVSLITASSSYFSGAPYPNHGIETMNILGEEGGIMTASDLFESTSGGLPFLTEYVNLDLRRQNIGPQEPIDISYYVELYNWNFFDHYNFNEKGMQINLSSASGLPHVLGSHEIYVPWQHVGQFLAPVARKTLLGS